jgi:hypothetical protein
MAEKTIGLMRHSRLGITIPVLTPAFLRWRARANVGKAEKGVEKLVSRIKGVCAAAGEIDAALTKAENLAERSDLLSARRRADTLRARFAKILDACREGSEIPKAKAEAEVVDAKRKQFLDDGDACNKEAGITTGDAAPARKQAWVACIQKKGWTGVASYLKKPERETFTL